MKSFIKRFVANIKDNFYAEQSRWIAWIPFLFACGIGTYYLLPIELNYWISLVIIEAVLFMFFLLRHRELSIFFSCLIIYLCGFINIQLQTIYSNKYVDFPKEKQTLYLQGKIIEISKSSKGKIRLLLDNVADFDNPKHGKYRITLNSKSSELKINQCVEMVATIFPPSRIPIFEGYQLDRKYFYNGLSAIGYTNSEAFEIDCSKDIASSSFSSRLNAIRKNIIDDIANVLPEDEAGVADSVLIGEQTLISEKILNQYRNSGLAHFLSVSGLHLGAIAGLIFFVIRLLLSAIPRIALCYDCKKISAVCAIVFSGLYLLVSGMAIPAQRAFIMTAVVFLGIIYNRQAISMRMVSFAGLAVLIYSPEALVSVSFQMSFSAVIALIAFYEKYAGKLASLSANANIVNKVIFYLVGIVICDFIASIATTPFAIYHFHRISIYTSLGNLLAGPLIGFWLMPMILICLVALPLGMLLYPLKILGYGLGVLNKITEFVSSLPNSVVYIDSLPFYGFILIVIGGFWLCVWQLPWRKWGIILIICGMIPMFFGKSPDVVFAAQGKGVAIRDNQGKMVLLPYEIEGFTKRVWQENLHLEILDKEQRKELIDIFNGRKTNVEWLDLQCDKKVCLYKNKIKFTPNGDIEIEQKDVETFAGGYIFMLQDNIKVVPFFNQKVCRLWQICNNQAVEINNNNLSNDKKENKNE